MTSGPEADILDDLLHGCAFVAFVELAIACRGVPDVDATRRLAYRYYEEELAATHGRRKAASTE